MQPFKGALDLMGKAALEEEFTRAIDPIIATPSNTKTIAHQKYIIFNLKTHASNVGISAILSQIQNGEGEILSYYAKSHN